MKDTLKTAVATLVFGWLIVTVLALGVVELVGFLVDRIVAMFGG